MWVMDLILRLVEVLVKLFVMVVRMDVCMVSVWECLMRVNSVCLREWLMRRERDRMIGMYWKVEVFYICYEVVLIFFKD